MASLHHACLFMTAGQRIGAGHRHTTVTAASQVLLLLGPPKGAHRGHTAPPGALSGPQRGQVSPRCVSLDIALEVVCCFFLFLSRGKQN